MTAAGREGSPAAGEHTAPPVEGLMVEVQRRLEALYAVVPQAPVSDFLMSAEEAGRYPGGGSRTLLREDGEQVAVGVVLDEGVREDLARADPRRRLHERNLGPFCTLIEEVSHFVYLLFCAAASRRVTQLELELQAEVDKYLSVAFLLSQQNDGAVSRSLRELLFRRYRLASGLSAEQEERYRAASRLAYRYCGFLESRFLGRRAGVADLAREARRFYRLDQRQKLERILIETAP